MTLSQQICDPLVESLCCGALLTHTHTPFVHAGTVPPDSVLLCTPATHVYKKSIIVELYILYFLFPVVVLHLQIIFLPLKMLCILLCGAYADLS